MKVAKTSKNLKEMPYLPQRKLLKRKGNNITIEYRKIGGVGRIGGLDIVIIINNRGGVGWGWKNSCPQLKKQTHYGSSKRHVFRVYVIHIIVLVCPISFSLWWTMVKMAIHTQKCEQKWLKTNNKWRGVGVGGGLE